MGGKFGSYMERDKCCSYIVIFKININSFWKYKIKKILERGIININRWFFYLYYERFLMVNDLVKRIVRDMFYIN